MASRRHLRAIGSVAVSVLLSLSLPGLALAESGAQPNQTLPEISGIVKDSGDTGIAGIQVIVLGFDTVVTDVNGAYSLMVANSSYTVHFADPAFKYLHGAYSDGASGNFSVGYSAGTSVAVPNHVTLKVVTMPVGVHITGRLTGPAVPPNPLGGLDVMASGGPPSYSERTTTAPDGTYSLTVPGGSSVTLGFGFNQSLYQDPCVNYAVVRSNMAGCSSVLMGDTDATGVNAQLGLAEGDTLALSPAETTVAAGTGQAFTATLGGGALVGLVPAGAVPAGQAAPTSADVTTVAAFTIAAAGGSAVPCAGATCTPSAAGDYTVSATYGITASAILHVTAAAAPAPTAATAVTPPPTSTGGSDDGGTGSPLALLLAGSAAAALMLVGLRRPLRS